jgi:hypothetical protein
MPSTQGFSTDLGLPKTPTAKDEEVFRELYIVYGALNALAAQLDAVVGLAQSAATDAVGSTRKGIAVADLSAGDLISITATGITKADASLLLPCYGLCTIGGVSGEMIEYILFGQASYSAATLVPGTRYYLNLAGAVSSAPYTSSGKIRQVVGLALTESLLYLTPSIDYTVNP